MKLYPILFFLFSLSISAQENKAFSELKNEPKLRENMRLLDFYMQNNDSKILELVSEDVSFGHSNGWVQNFDDFKKDFESKKVSYKSIEQTDLSEFKRNKKTVSLRRKVKVAGIYKVYDFEMTLSLLEIWIKKGKSWRLWSRQAIELKEKPE
ncbi:nuclear transport factor 2 family protein [Flavobacterium macacae]|uniref:Nuclear transport factor 2 family protein n=1 Tax=Flavobacterium macacae TaxID=2488993 RepID=A0A3P3WLA5_9FLAO|nr:nuclear transport factor 2 family protein [Flavobacterium macacae]RRJ93943.1 nuclear transport factor 2 family protein [Flavobacterium macacae]